MADENMRDKDMVLAPNEFMYVLDKTKGHVDVFVGPTKQSLSGTDAPVVFDEAKKQFKEANHTEAKQLMKTAPEGWYVVLKNPAKDGKPPIGNGKQTAAHLEVGKKVNLPGPVSFCLWPGQMAKVLKGHHLRSNQYLLGRVYDEAAARENWKKAVVKRVSPAPATQPGSQGTSGQQTSGTSPAQEQAQPPQTPTETLVQASELTMGQLLIIKGTDVSFYIPPTGVEIMADEAGELVREAVTLERLEYCLLMDENGNKRYERGPAVVFPEPTEVFATTTDKDGEETRKFSAIELNENSGIYVKVIADYVDEETKKEYKVGDERFITGKETMIYFPRAEHAIIKYDNNEIHYGIAIPDGEARYVMNRNTGIIDLVKGPKVFLPDPRTEVVVRRILDFKTCSLLFPNNQQAFAHNAALAGVDLDVYMSADEGPVAVAAAMDANVMLNYAAPAGAVLTRGLSPGLGDSARSRGLRASAAKGFSGSSFDRKTKYTEPRSITLPTKFDGAVSLNIYTGYAMMLVRKSGDRRVVMGPQTVLLEYDELPEVMELSTGKPKNTDNLHRTAYLRVKANKVSDVVGAQTSDYCDVRMKLSYLMDFTGENKRWFDVENYVKFMCDNLRSKLKSEARKHTIEHFYANSTDIIKAVVAGKDGKGTLFEENGMHVYDVEVLGVEIESPEIQKLIVESQRDAIKSNLNLAAEKRKFEVSQETEELARKREELRAATETAKIEISSDLATKKLGYDLLVIEATAKAESEKSARSLEIESAKSKVDEVVRERFSLNAKAESEAEVVKQAAKVQMTETETNAAIARLKAVDPTLVAALQAFGDKALIEKIATAVGPLTVLGGESATDIIAKVLKGTPVAKHLAAAASAVANGGAPARA